MSIWEFFRDGGDGCFEYWSILLGSGKDVFRRHYYRPKVCIKIELSRREWVSVLVLVIFDDFGMTWIPKHQLDCFNKSFIFPQLNYTVALFDERVKGCLWYFGQTFFFVEKKSLVFFSRKKTKFFLVFFAVKKGFFYGEKNHKKTWFFFREKKAKVLLYIWGRKSSWVSRKYRSPQVLVFLHIYLVFLEF